MCYDYLLLNTYDNVFDNNNVFLCVACFKNIAKVCYIIVKINYKYLFTYFGCNNCFNFVVLIKTHQPHYWSLGYYTVITPVPYATDTLVLMSKAE